VLDADGWLQTSDIATIDPDGCLRLVDRAKDVIKSGGEWISSVAVENAAMSHPGVLQAAVIGIAHTERSLVIRADAFMSSLLKYILLCRAVLMRRFLGRYGARRVCR
jgi:acyl-CoA synthetase (AMP-forming)/AMP-acid ligase II